MEHHDNVPTQTLSAGTENRHHARRGARNALACAAAVTLAGIGIAVPANTSLAQPAVHQTTTPVKAADAVQQIVDLVNAERAKAGCGAVRVDGKAQAAAQAHADDMAARNYYAHKSPEGADAGDRLNAAGYEWRKWRENIHKGVRSPEEAMRDWINSSAHRANILDCGVGDLGVGVNSSANGPWWVQVFAA
ncbi:CAP domain-containing protein [Actinosynnema sp. CS-041913]|uniref:CAP domain-containing protein n=1 Tax=Actinosynnema sp. CS-041913 TaxID=3239917 RepID=UPI003D8BBF49